MWLRSRHAITGFEPYMHVKRESCASVPRYIGFHCSEHCVATISIPSTTNFCNSLTTRGGWSNPACPTIVDAAQPDLAINGRDDLSGYFSKNSRTAVLGKPNLDQYGEASDSFARTIKRFFEFS